MKITKDNVSNIRDILIDVTQDSGQAFIDAAEIWLDEDCDADERRDAREEIENSIEELSTHLEDLMELIK